MTTRIAFLGVALLATALLAAITLELGSGEPAEDQTGIVPIRHLPKIQPHVASEDPEDHTDAWAATILARPLFSRDRKPTPTAAKGGGGPSFAALPRLTGVIVGPFGRTAIFAGAEGAKPIAVSEGGALGAYRVETIAPGGVTVSGPEGQRRVSLAADATIRSQLAAEMPAPPPQPQAQPPGVPGLPNGIQPGVPFNLQQRQNLLNLRGGQLQRAMQGIQQPPQPAQQGSD